MSKPQNTAEPQRVFVKGWDPVVRFGHWTMVLCFMAVYVTKDKFPLHIYAAYVIMAYMLFRIIWGFVGSRSARFLTFIYGPKTTIKYIVDSAAGHPMHTISHNPLGAPMVFMLIFMLLATSVLGLLLYSSGEQMGLLGDMVPPEWEDELFEFGDDLMFGVRDLHIYFGHAVAIFVCMHIVGTFIATAGHKTSHVIPMLIGVKDAEVDDPELKYYQQVPEPTLGKGLSEKYGPVLTDLIFAAGVVFLIIVPLVLLLGWLNKFMPTI